MDSSAPSPLSMGARYAGAVTQSGTILDGGLHFEALQACEIVFLKVDHHHCTCRIYRQETHKFINGIEDPNDPSLSQPVSEYLRLKGASFEMATGTYDPFNRVLLLRGSTPSVIRYSNVVWNQHFYSLVVGEDRIVGTVFCIDEMDDRENGVGSLEVCLCQN